MKLFPEILSDQSKKDSTHASAVFIKDEINLK